ncbi:hypothetical protein [Novosphingobium sp. BL-52-GroH]|uniref:hypothetical protein n=1 Tax=Novosphingobium sp. BL-52-GroH TaxID=3349877 RepID=UPI00384E050F
MMPYDAGTKLEGNLKFIGLIGMALFIGAALFLGPKPKPDPLNHLAYGCFASKSAPPIRLEANGMIIEQKNFPIIGFHLERHKTGIALTAERPISADASASGYRYSIDKRGSGKFLNFYKVINQETYGVFDETDLHSFRMLANDGQYIAYSRADPAECA